MTTVAPQPIATRAYPVNKPVKGSALARLLRTTDAKQIGIMYLVTSFGFFLTPVVYPVPTRGLFALLVNLNPVTPLLVTTRELVTGTPLSQPVAFAGVVLLSVVLLLAGWIAYRVSMPIVLERSKS